MKLALTGAMTASVILGSGLGALAPMAPSAFADGMQPPAPAFDAERLPSDGAYALTLGETTFDPLAGPLPEVPGWMSEPADGEHELRLVQFNGPIRDAWLEALRERGLGIVSYVHPYTYVVWGTPAALDAAQGLQAVRWSGEFHPAYRVLPRWRHLADAPIDVAVLLFRGADTDAAVRAIAGLGGQSTGRKSLNDTFELARFTISGARFAELARVPGVYSVQPAPTDGGLRGEMTNQICAGNYSESGLAFPGYADWLGTIGLDGAGVVMANVDGGIQDSHPDLVSRLLPCTGDTCGGGAQSSHGTHTAGIMAADGASGTLDSFGFLRGQGVAPGANLVEQVYSPTFTQPGGMLKLMRESYANGAQLSGNSWGPAGTPRGYDNDTMQVDIGARDTDQDTPGDQPLLYVLSFMNGNGGTSTQGTPDEAKNIFTVGSTRGQGSGGQYLDIDNISSNSAHGPALDGRTIPHIVAPGCSVDSSVTGSSYGLLCGTSMASPHVSGASALFIEKYRAEFGIDPSPALVKAAFSAVAHDLAGNLDADGGVLGHPFDSKQGWGRMNMPATLAPAETVRYWDQETIFDESGEEWSVTISPYDPAQPVRIMLAWTDAPGHGLGGSTPAWNNDLDLIVEAGGTYYGNDFGADGWSVTGGTPDGRNNTEAVFLGPIPPGGITIRVRATNISSDGLPNSGDATDQDFAIVAYNAAEEPAFTMSSAPTDQAVCAPGDAVYEITIGQVLGYDLPVTLDASGHPAGTSVSFSTNPVVPPATTTMTISNTGSAAGGDYDVDIMGVSPDLDRMVTVGLTLDAGAPDAVVLAQPADGAEDVAVVPTLEWNASTGAAEYLVQVARDASFTDVVFEAVTDETAVTLDSALDSETTHYWRAQASNSCGEGSVSSVWSFTTLEVPPILLVDDDDNNPNVRDHYAAAMGTMGLTYDVWDTQNSDNEPSATDLAAYSVVIWFTGDEFGGFSGPGAAGEAALATWLDNGGCLLISSQDYYWDRGLTGFMSAYLGVGSAESDVSQSTVTGNGDVFGGMGPYGLIYPFTNYSDRVDPNAGGLVSFVGNQGNAAVQKETGTYRTTFMGFPLEAVALNDRVQVVQTMLDWCGGLTPDCPADIDGDGAVAVTDLLAVLAAWGQSGDADVNDDGTVDVQDLLIVLGAWGVCGQ